MKIVSKKITKKTRALCKNLLRNIRTWLSGKPKELYAAHRYQKSFASKCYLQSGGKVNIPYLETDIVLGCNLRCCHCSHLSPYRKGFVPTANIVHWFETWSKKIRPAKLDLLGGEPFLHPDLAAVLLESRRIWNRTKIDIVSNGLLIHQAPQEVFDALKRAKIRVVISDHSGADLLREKVVAGCARLKQHRIPYSMRSSNDKWAVQHQWSEEGIPLPFQSLPYDAWSICTSKRRPSLANNRLYKCAVLASIIEGVKEGSFSPLHWQDALTYSALSPDANAETIIEHFRTQEVMECCICPNKIVLTEATQLLHMSSSRKKAS